MCTPEALPIATASYSAESSLRALNDAPKPPPAQSKPDIVSAAAGDIHSHSSREDITAGEQPQSAQSSQYALGVTPTRHSAYLIHTVGGHLGRFICTVYRDTFSVAT